MQTRRILRTLPLFLLFATTAMAAEAIIVGKVKDQQGNKLDGVTITVYDAASGRKVKGKTEDGGYYIRGIPPADYAITYEKEGYGSHTWTGHLKAGKKETINIVLGSKAKAKAKAIKAEKVEGAGKAFRDGVELFGRKDYDGAIAAFKKSLEKNPDLPDTYYDIGLCYQKKKDFKNAEIWLQQAVEKAPTNAGAYFNLAFASFALKKVDAGVAAVRKPTDLDATADTAYNAGALLKNFQENEEAAAMFQEAIKRDAAYADAYRELGYLQLGKGEMAAAKQSLSKYIELRPTAKDKVEIESMLKDLK